MCHQSLAVGRGIKFPRISEREERLKSITPQRDEEDVAKKKNIHLKKSRQSRIVAKRARRTKDKKARAGMKNLHRLGLIR